MSTDACTGAEERGVVCDLGQMAKLVVYLSSEDAELVNGATWTADGGWSAF